MRLNGKTTFRHPQSPPRLSVVALPVPSLCNHLCLPRLRRCNMPKRPPVFRPVYAGQPSDKQRKADYDRKRPSAAKRGYDHRWAKARKDFLFRNPLCVHCQSLGVICPSTEVDHIKPHKGDQELFWDQSNWQALCKPCHSRKTATEDSRFAALSVAAPERG